MLSCSPTLPFSHLFADNSSLSLYQIEACSTVQVHKALALISGMFNMPSTISYFIYCADVCTLAHVVQCGMHPTALVAHTWLHTYGMCPLCNTHPKWVNTSIGPPALVCHSAWHTLCRPTLNAHPSMVLKHWSGIWFEGLCHSVHVLISVCPISVWSKLFQTIFIYLVH